MEICNETSTIKDNMEKSAFTPSELGGGGAKGPYINVVSTEPVPMTNEINSYVEDLGSFNTSKRPMDFSEYSAKRNCVSQEFEREQEQEKIPKSKPTQSFNLKTLTDPQSAYKGKYESYAKHYLSILSNMIVKNSQEFTKFYFPGSMLTIAVYDAGTCQVQEVGGEQNILSLFQKISMYRKYNASLISIQPGLGQGATITIEGTLGTLYQNHIKGFTMTINLVNLRKTPYILNQTFIIR